MLNENIKIFTNRLNICLISLNLQYNNSIGSISRFKNNGVLTTQNFADHSNVSLKEKF